MNSGAWATILRVDEAVSAQSSVPLRYLPMLDLFGEAPTIDAQTVRNCSISEGARIMPLCRYQSVEIVVCDETSLMHTGTYKDIDACLTTALCLSFGWRGVVTSSGGNLGTALCTYAERVGLDVLFFFPKSALRKIPDHLLSMTHVRAVCADLPERQVKDLARRVAERLGIAMVPELSWRLAASALRAAFIMEQGPPKIDMIAQTVCAGYGPAGIYSFMGGLADRGFFPIEAVPSFLAVQQEANAPMARAWNDRASTIEARHVRPEPRRYIEPSLYNTNPADNYGRLRALMTRFGGDFITVDEATYCHHEPRVLDWLEDVGIRPSRYTDTGSIIEKAGLITGVGILHAIDQGMIRPGCKVLYLLTGGCRQGEFVGRSADPSNRPIFVDRSRSIDYWVDQLAGTFSAPERSVG